MVGMAAGKVWQFDIDKTEFEQALDKSRIVNHIQKDDRIRSVIFRSLLRMMRRYRWNRTWKMLIFAC